MVEMCKNCHYFRKDRCHRHAPRSYNFIRYYGLELIRDIAWSMRVNAGLDLPETDSREDLNTEATETCLDTDWPTVEAGDWCGEWMRKKLKR